MVFKKMVEMFISNLDRRLKRLPLVRRLQTSLSIPNNILRLLYMVVLLLLLSGIINLRVVGDLPKR